MIRTLFIISLAFGMGLAATIYLIFANPGLILGLGVIVAFTLATVALATRGGKGRQHQPGA
ncbi:MAG: hypothetical protein AAFR34_02045 [Pseudomonadota bacterium]